MKTLSRIYTALIFVFLFAPIAILLFFSFNASRSLSVFSGFSLDWYREFFHDAESITALRNTLLLALASATASTVIGLSAAFGINALRNRYLKATLNTVTNIPMINPDIITGISMMLMFVFIGQLLGAKTSLNFGTMLIAHITFCLPQVILQILPKLRQSDPSLVEAAKDLGCTPFRAFLKISIPEIMPAVATGFIMAFTLSLDDFVISYFTSGNDFQTLPIRIYNMTKKTVTPKMYALATVVFIAIMVLLIMKNVLDTASLDNGRRHHVYQNKMRLSVRGIGLICLGIIGAAVVIVLLLTRNPARVLNVYNWGEYISDGSEDSFNTVAEFEKWYEETYGQKVTVNYQTYASNEDMYAKISSGSVSYDVIIPSDYMIERMIAEDLLLPLDFDNIPNFEYIGESYRHLRYDPDNVYSIPYTASIVGVIYNANVVDEEDIGDWSLLWNPKYADEILQFNNSRDAFATAQYMLGLDVNSLNPADWDLALDKMLEQRPLVKSYVMDEIYNMMEAGEAAIGVYYAGDYFTMVDGEADDVDLQFYYPEPTNYFVDAMCIPTCCCDKELAECFINYMLSEEPAIANAAYIYYPSPNRLVYENEDYLDEIGEEAYEILYAKGDAFAENYNRYAYENLSPDMLKYINTLWEALKIN